MLPSRCCGLHELQPECPGIRDQGRAPYWLTYQVITSIIESLHLTICPPAASVNLQRTIIFVQDALRLLDSESYLGSGESTLRHIEK